MDPSETPWFKFDPTEVDNVKLYCWAASGQNIDLLRREEVCSDHPSILYGSSEPVNDVRKVHMAWSKSLSDSVVRTIGSGYYYWRESGPKVLIYENTAEPAIGFCQKYVLVKVKTGKAYEWVLREYKAFGEQYNQCQSSIYEITFESKAYLKALTLLQRARVAFEKLSEPFDPSETESGRKALAKLGEKKSFSIFPRSLSKKIIPVQKNSSSQR